MRTRIAITTGIVTLVLTASGLALAFARHPDVAHRAHVRQLQTLHPARNNPPVRTVDQRISRDLRIFRAARTSAAETGLPGSLAQIFNQRITPATGANPSLAREIATSTGTFYIVPGNGQLCQVAAGGIGCGPTSKLGVDPRAYVLFGSSQANPPNTVAVSGIAADDVQSVTATLADGSTRDIPIDQSAYSTLLPTSARTLTFQTSDHGSFALDVPSAPPPPPPHPHP